MKRVITAIVGIAIILPAMYFGGPFITLLVLLAGLAAQYELYKLFEAGQVKPFKSAGMLIGSLLLLHSVIADADPLLTIVLGILFIGIAELFRGQLYPHLNFAATMFGVFYPIVFLSYMLEIRMGTDLKILNDPEMQGFWLVLAIFLMVAATDTFAYYAGTWWGNTLLFQRISPKKTWEGSIAGVIGAIVVGVAFKMTVLNFLSWIDISALIFICGVFSQFGDLVESMLKRAVEVKDSGSILPGHGGVLDRIDALVFALPVVYMYLRYIAPLF